MAGETMLAFTGKDREWFYNESKLKYELDMQDMKARYLREGREEGRREGLEEGKTEGLILAKKQTALKMKAAGVPVEQIQTFIGLPAEEINKL